MSHQNRRYSDISKTGITNKGKSGPISDRLSGGNWFKYTAGFIMMIYTAKLFISVITALFLLGTDVLLGLRYIWMRSSPSNAAGARDGP